jgi:sugar-specific transcriptional regulator TrmB
MSDFFPRKILRKFGLTEKEAEVYIFLAKKGILKGGDVGKGLQMNKAQAYHTLKILQNKGMVETTVEFPARFAAVPLGEVIDSIIRAKREEANCLETDKRDLLCCWKATKPSVIESRTEKLMVIEGNSRIYSRIFQMAENTKKEMLAVVCHFALINSVQAEIGRIIKKKARKTGIRLRLLTQTSSENNRIIRRSLTRISKRKTRSNIECRSLNSNLELKTRFFVIDEEEALLFITSFDSIDLTNETEICLWTNCKAVVSILRVFFEKLWTGSAGFDDQPREAEIGNEFALA